MNKTPYLLIALLTAILFALGIQPAVAGDQDFRLYNRTGVDIYAVYISPTGEESWEENVMDGDVLLDEADILIAFPNAADAQYWDIRVEDDEGNFLYWEEIDLFSAYAVILNEDGTARIKE